MTDLSKNLTVTVQKETFELDITDLTVDGFVQIEKEKARMSNGNYPSLITSELVNAYNAGALIDMIVLFRFFNDRIEKSLSNKSFDKLTLFESKELLDVYKKQLSPWYYAWMKEFNSPFGEDAE